MDSGFKQTIAVIILIIVTFVATFVSTYSYFVLDASNENDEELSVTAGTMKLVFSDDDATSVITSLNFGDSSSTSFSIENTGTIDTYAKICWKNLVNTYQDGSLVYTLEYKTADGDYKTIVENKNVPQSEKAQTLELQNGLLIPTGTKYYYKLTITLVDLESVDQTDDLNASFYTEFTLRQDAETKNIINDIIADAKTTSPDFSKVATTDEGVYSMEDDYGTSYYFRGAVENNYVKFAGFYWRIIRINGDGTVRIIYDGTKAHKNGESSTDRVALSNIKYNSNYNDAAYEGYMYGLAGTTTDASRCLILNSSETVEDKVSTYTTKTACENAGGKWTTTAYEATHANVKSSTIKIALDAWYKTNIVDTGYSKYVADEIFCDDRQIATDLANSNGGAYSSYTTLGYGTNDTIFMPLSRVGYNVSNPTPSLKCSQKNDAFTVGTKNGNGDLTYPVGLIMADEISLAGGFYNTNNYNYYLYKGVWNWSISAAISHAGYVGTFAINSTGDNSGDYVAYAGGAAPVINLTAEYFNSLSGDGTIDNPYTND